MPSVELDDRVADPDRSAHDDVGVDPGAVGEILDDAGPRHLLEVRARLAQLNAEALDVADAEAPADEIVHLHPAQRHLSPRLAECQPDVLDDRSVDQRQSLTGAGPGLVEVAVALQPLPGHGDRRVDRVELCRLARADVNRLDRHVAIMHEAAAAPAPLDPKRASAGPLGRLEADPGSSSSKWLRRCTQRGW